MTGLLLGCLSRKGGFAYIILAFIQKNREKSAPNGLNTRK